MRKRIINIVMALSLVVTSGGWAMTHDNNNLLLKVVHKQKVDFNKQSTEIANLENVIVQRDNDLNAKNMVIEKQKLQVNEQVKQLKDLKKQNEKLKHSINLKKNKKEGSGGKELVVNASAYIAMCQEGCSGRTKSGYNVTNTIHYKGMRIIASDLSVLPMYSIVEIEGFSERFIVLDSGGAIKGNKIDVLVDSMGEAMKFGRKNLKVKVIKNGV